MSNCTVKLTDTAKADLRQIAHYIAEQSKDKTLAVLFVADLREKCNLLKTFPESGSVPKDRVLMSNGYRFLVHREYLIFYLYEKQENTAYVMAIFNGKRDYMKIMKKFI